MNIAFAVCGLTIWGPSGKHFDILKTFCKLFELPDKKKGKGKGYNRVYMEKVGALN
jgi:hypothetical protein